MPTNFASADWCQQLYSALVNSADLRTQSVTWVHGPLMLIVDEDSEHGFERTQIRLSLHEGTCRSVTLDEEAHHLLATPFTISGSLARWRSMINGEIPVLKAILGSQVRFNGDLPTIARHEHLLDAIMGAARFIDTLWADEQPAKESSATA